MRRLLILPLAGVILSLLLNRDAAADWPWPVHFLFPPQAGLDSACLTCGWHGACVGPTPAPGTALDFGGACSDGNYHVYLRAYGFHTPWSSTVYVGYAAYDLPGTLCKEVDARIWDRDGNYLGATRYMHTENPWPEVVDLFGSGYSGYLNEQPFANMTHMDTSGCIAQGYWTLGGEHVHEYHANGTGATFFLRNGGNCQPTCGTYPFRPQPNCTYDPRDWYANWVRGLCANDPDCDFFKDAKEQYMGTDPQDGCPDNSSDRAWPPDINNDRRVQGLDVLYLRPAINSHVGDPKYNPRYDLDASGVINGLDVLFIRPFMATRCSQ